jgi:hypothetical protein
VTTGAGHRCGAIEGGPDMPRGVPKKVGVMVNLGVVEVSGEWEPNDVERAAA